MWLDEQSSLLNQRATIDNRVAQLERMIESIAPLADINTLPSRNLAIAQPLPPLLTKTLAEACRIVLAHEQRFMTPIAIRDMFIKNGYDTDRQTNLLALIHAICKRLVESGEAEQQMVEGKAFYRQKPEPSTFLPIED